jgi:hypothetical protein
MNVSQVSIGKFSVGQMLFDQKTLNQTEAELGSTYFSLRVFFFLPKCGFVVFKSLKTKVNFSILFLCVVIPNFWVGF